MNEIVTPSVESGAAVGISALVRRKKDGVKPTDARPCPFCGETPQVVRESELNWIGGKYDTFFIRCKKTKCLVKPSVSKRTLREVMEAWNTRNPFA